MASQGGIQMVMGSRSENKVQQMPIFFKRKIHYLGYLVGTNGMQPLPEKVAAIQAMELPKDIKELQHFLGLVNSTGGLSHFLQM